MQLPLQTIDQLFADWDRPDSPGCVLGIIYDGELVYARGYGMADLEHGICITPDTVFDIGSTSKQFTAACILLLAQEGSLSLDDPLQVHFSELPGYGANITLRHLLHHTSGLRDYLVLMDLAGMPFENDYPEAEIYALVTRQQALNFAPGDEHLYCNTGYLLLAEVVRRVSGKSLRQFAQERIFGRLGMLCTHFHDDFTELVPGRALGYAARPEGGFRLDISLFDVVGDGCLYTTLGDLLLWDRQFYAPSLGGESFITQLTMPGVLNSGEKLDYAMGLVVSEYRGLPTISHGGSWAGFRAQFLRFPAQRFSVICLANLGEINAVALAKQVAGLCLAEEMQPPPQEPAATEAVPGLPASALAPWAGMYRNALTQGLLEISLEDGELRVYIGGDPFPLHALGSERFIVGGLPLEIVLHFHSADQGSATLQALIEDREPEQYEKLPPLELSVAELQKYVGVYVSPELDVRYALALKDGQLQLVRRGAAGEVLKVTLADTFKFSRGVLTFLRDSNGEICGFQVQAGRVKGLVFHRQIDL